MNKEPLSTEELFHKLSRSKHIDEFLQQHEYDITNIDLQTYLYHLLQKTGYTIPLMIEKASISRSLAYQIFSGKRTPNRNQCFINIRYFQVISLLLLIWGRRFMILSAS